MQKVAFSLYLTLPDNGAICSCTPHFEGELTYCMKWTQSEVVFTEHLFKSLGNRDSLPFSNSSQKAEYQFTDQTQFRLNLSKL